MECFDFLNESEKDNQYLYKFLIEFCEKYFIPRDTLVKVAWVTVYNKKDVFDYSKINTVKLWEQIKKTHFEGFFWESNWDNSKSAPIWSIVHILGEQTGQDPYKILSEWKYPQFIEWLDGYTWNMREQTEEGRKKNATWRLRNRDKEFIKKREDEIKESIKDIDISNFDITKLNKNA